MMIVHHIDGDPSHNTLRNLTTVCQACNLIIHSGWGTTVAKIVDLYQGAGSDQKTVLRKTFLMRARGYIDPEIRNLLGLTKKVTFSLQRSKLKNLIGFISDRRARQRDVNVGLREITSRLRLQEDALRDHRLQESNESQDIAEARGANLSRRRSFNLQKGFTPDAMLRSSFIQVPRIGAGLERRIWESGIHDWNTLESTQDTPSFLRNRKNLILDHVKRSLLECPKGQWTSLSRLEEKGEAWRFFGTLRKKTLYLDIETTGLNRRFDEITLIGTYDGNSFRYFTRGENLNEFPSYARQYQLLVTFNGNSFDLPFIRAEFGGDAIPQPSWDLRWSLYRLGHKGTLKVIEDRLRVPRNLKLQPISGFDAIVLWRAYMEGTEAALDILQRYCAEDVASLPILAARAYNALSAKLPIFTSKVPEPKRPKPEGDVEPKALRRILAYLFDPRAPEVVNANSALRAARSYGTPSRERKRYWIIVPSSRCKTRLTQGGKWLVFLPRKKIDSVWQLISENLQDGDLGKLSTGAKASTRRPNELALKPNTHVICVYVPDSRNIPNIMRVRNILKSLGITQRIPFKTDTSTTQNMYAVHHMDMIAEFWA